AARAGRAGGRQRGNFLRPATAATRAAAVERKITLLCICPQRPTAPGLNAASSTLHPALGCSTRRNRDQDIIGVVQPGRCWWHRHGYAAEWSAYAHRGGA